MDWSIIYSGGLGAFFATCICCFASLRAEFTSIGGDERRTRKMDMSFVDFEKYTFLFCIMHLLLCVFYWVFSSNIRVFGKHFYDFAS